MDRGVLVHFFSVLLAFAAAVVASLSTRGVLWRLDNSIGAVHVGTIADAGKDQLAGTGEEGGVLSGKVPRRMLYSRSISRSAAGASACSGWRDGEAEGEEGGVLIGEVPKKRLYSSARTSGTRLSTGLR